MLNYKKILSAAGSGDSKQVSSDEDPIIPQNCGTCYELTCPTEARCGACGVLKGFPKWRISVDAKQAYKNNISITKKRLSEYGLQYSIGLDSGKCRNINCFTDDEVDRRLSTLIARWEISE